MGHPHRTISTDHQLASAAGTAPLIAVHTSGTVTVSSDVAVFFVPQPGAQRHLMATKSLAQADQLESKGIYPRSDQVVLGPALLEADDHIVEGPLIQPRLE